MSFLIPNTNRLVGDGIKKKILVQYNDWVKRLILIY